MRSNNEIGQPKRTVIEVVFTGTGCDDSLLPTPADGCMSWVEPRAGIERCAAAWSEWLPVMANCLSDQVVLRTSTRLPSACISQGHPLEIWVIVSDDFPHIVAMMDRMRSDVATQVDCQALVRIYSVGLARGALIDSTANC